MCWQTPCVLQLLARKSAPKHDAQHTDSSALFAPRALPGYLRGCYAAVAVTQPSLANERGGIPQTGQHQ
eukprot:10328309-Alexandrium_andersonii.AAC.1